MPVRHLPPRPSLDHLRYQARDLRAGHAAHDPAAAQRLREFHPRFHTATDSQIFAAQLSLAEAQLAIAREYGFPSWTRLKAHLQAPSNSPRPLAPNEPIHERIQDPTFRRAVDLLDAGDLIALRAHLKQHPAVVHQRITFEGVNYFRNPTLLAFTAENPVRHGVLPANIVAVATAILDAGADTSSLNETLVLVCSGRVPRECGVQQPFIDLLCDRGADPAIALPAALTQGEFAAANALLAHGAALDLPTAAALGRTADLIQLLPHTSPEDRQRALALASQFGQLESVRALLDAGEDPDHYNPVGAHSHSTPLHQAALAGHTAVVDLLLSRGASADRKDILWQGTAADWAEHAGHTTLAAHLRSLEKA